MKAALFDCWHGLGNNIYFRPAVRVLADRYDLFVQTPWPEFFADLQVRFAKPPVIRHVTAAKNAARQPAGRWSIPPADAELIQPQIYAPGESTMHTIARSLGLDVDELNARLDLPPFPMPFPLPGPVAVVRPVVVRAEFPAESRNPLPEYIAEAAALLMMRGFSVVSVADLHEQEWALEPLPVAHLRFHSGELDVTQLCGLIEHAAVVVTGPGWAMNAALACGTPLVTICGGRGQRDSPMRLTAGSGALAHWIVPDNLCMCDDLTHNCDRTISHFTDHFNRAMRGI